MNTSVKQKKQYWPEFIKACESQWVGGGDRYALTEDKEFTDLICEVIGNKFCGSQIIKHVGELINTDPKPEVAFYKIAVWAFIWWLKEKENLTQRDKGEEFDTDETVVADNIKNDKEETVAEAKGVVEYETTD